MKRGFLLSDNKQLNVSVSPKLSEKVAVKHEILDPALGLSMVKLTAEEGMNVKVRTDKDGNVFFEAVENRGGDVSKWEVWHFDGTKDRFPRLFGNQVYGTTFPGIGTLILLALDGWIIESAV